MPAKKTCLAGVCNVLAIIALSLPASSADLTLGKKKARMCNVCHGKNGLATNPEAPNLAGESSIYIEKQLLAFRKGERKHRQMTIIAKQLKDDDIKNLAAWYEAMKVTVELPDLSD